MRNEFVTYFRLHAAPPLPPSFSRLAAVAVAALPLSCRRGLCYNSALCNVGIFSIFQAVQFSTIPTSWSTSQPWLFYFSTCFHQPLNRGFILPMSHAEMPAIGSEILRRFYLWPGNSAKMLLEKEIEISYSNPLTNSKKYDSLVMLESRINSDGGKRAWQRSSELTSKKGIVEQWST